MMVREVFSSPERERHSVVDEPDIVSQISQVRSGLKIHYRIGRIQFVSSLVLGFYVPFNLLKGAHGLSGIVLDWRPKGRGFEPHWRHCVVVLEQDTFILA